MSAGQRSGSSCIKGQCGCKNGKIFFGFLVIVLVFIFAYNMATQGADETVNSNEATNQYQDQAQQGQVSTVQTQDKQNNQNATVENIYPINQQQALHEKGFWISALDNEVPQTYESEDGSITYTFNDTDSVSIMPVAAQSIIRNSYGADTEEEIFISGYNGSLITGTSAKDGSEVKYILVSTDINTFFARGNDEFLEIIQQQALLP